MSPTVTLSTVPSDIIYGICEHLSDRDFMKLQLVSAALCSKLPRSRLDKIHSRRIVRFTDTETRKLKRLVSTRPEKLTGIKRLVFNITSPYIIFIPEILFSLRVRTSSWSTRVKMLKFCHNYRERNPSERNFFRSVTLLKRDAIAVPHFHPAPEKLLRLRHGHCPEFFSILTSTIQPTPKFDQKAFFKALTEVLKLLPNLQILEFVEDYPHPQGRDEVSLLFEEYNHSLKTFVSKNPDLEELPWREWLQVTENPIRFDTAYSTVLFCAALARCRITEIRANGMRFISDSDTGVSLSRFSTYSTGTVSIPISLRQKRRYEAAYLNHYQQAFENLRRLEIWCSGVDPELNTTEKVSPLFLATIQNVQELSFRRPVDYQHIYFITIPNKCLPNLRRLEIISARVDLNSLRDFARTNENSLRELICRGPCTVDMSIYAIIEFLEDMRRTVKLETCQIDFVTHSRGMCEACFLLVDINGSWRDDLVCKYRFGLRCVHRECSFEPREGPDWVEQQSWEEFIIGIKELGASKDCRDHWGRTLLY